MFRYLFLFLIIINFLFSESKKDRYGWTAIRDRTGIEKELDMFGRDRNGLPLQSGGGYFINGISKEDFGISTSDSGIVTHNNVAGLAQIKSGPNLGSAKLRTHTYFFYQPSKSQEIKLSLAPFNATTGTIKTWGYNDDNDGIYWKVDGSDNLLQFCILSSTSGTPIESCVDQNHFNRMDADTTKYMREEFTLNASTIYGIEAQWLGSGIAKGTIVNKNGVPMLIHVFENPNKNEFAYMKRGSLPVNLQVITDGTNTEENKINFICYSVVSNGGEKPTIRSFADFLPAIGQTTNNLENHVVSFRLKDDFKGNVNTTTVFPEALRVKASGGTIRYRIYKDCDMTGENWIDANAQHSAVQYSITGTISNCFKKIENDTIFGTTQGQTATGDSAEIGFRAFNLTRKAFNQGSETVHITIERVLTAEAYYDISVIWGESR